MHICVGTVSADRIEKKNGNGDNWREISKEKSIYEFYAIILSLFQ